MWIHRRHYDSTAKDWTGSLSGTVWSVCDRLQRPSRSNRLPGWIAGVSTELCDRSRANTLERKRPVHSRCCVSALFYFLGWVRRKFVYDPHLSQASASSASSILGDRRHHVSHICYIYSHPLTIFGVGFGFAALTGIFFKEAFCFDRLETKLLTPLIPILLLGHLTGFLPMQWEQILLEVWAVLFVVFAIRKVIQPIPPDIGDKSVFEYLHSQQLRNDASNLSTPRN